MWLIEKTYFAVTLVIVDVDFISNEGSSIVEYNG
jgi:hypothetical protein